MKKLSYLLIPCIALIISFFLTSQSTPNNLQPDKEIIVNNNTDTTKLFSTPPIFTDLVIPSGQGNKNPMELKDLSVKTLIVGTMARTEMEFLFSNPNDMELEGEFYFPLGEGKTITRLALEVEGKLREGVVVGKEKGRVAFESTVRKKVDPALLEWTKGNNFKARIFPIPAKGTKRIVIAYEESLLLFDSESVYTLNLGIKKEVKNFRYQADIIGGQNFPTTHYNKLEGLSFMATGSNYTALVEQTNITPNQFISIEIPKEINPSKTYTETSEGTTYFSASTFPSVVQQAKPQPSHIGVYWDVSHSEYIRDKSKEIQFLKTYLESLSGTVTIDIIPFHIKLEQKKTFSISNGNTLELVSYLKNLNYDGATNFDVLDFNNPQWQEILLISDGINTYGKSSEFSSEIPVYCVSNNEIADYDKLKAISSLSGGEFINLAKTPIKNSISLLKNQLYRLIKVEIKEGQIEEIYPLSGTIKSSSFSVSGKLISEQATLLLKFGIGNQVMEEKELVIYKNPVSGLVKNKWARLKLEHLMIESKKNESEITEHAKAFKLVTPFTSLIVLDRLEDYLEHDIVPPTEMQKEFYKQKQKVEKNEKEELKAQLDRVKTSFKQRITWWETEFNLPKPKLEKNVIIDTVNMTDTSVVAINFSSPLISSEDIQEMPDRSSGSIAATVGGVAVEEDVALEEFTVMEVQSSQRNGLFRRREQSSTDGYLNENGDNFEVADEEKSFETLKHKADTKEIKLNKWSSKAKYIEKLKKTQPEDLVKEYYKLKKENSSTPAFYVDVCSYLQELNENEMAERIISNLVELEGENHELMRGLANKLLELNKTKKAVELLEEVKELRKEEPQSFRDLGLGYVRNNEPQKAIETLYHVVTTQWSRFDQIEQIVLNEINQIIASNPSLDTDFMDKELVKNLPVDIRVVLNWDANNTDIDLWVTDPTGEKCDYSHNRTTIGGFMTSDFTQGYGPEVFMLKKGMKGTYKIEANYYGNNSSSVVGPVSLKMQFFTNYGKPNQKVKEVILRLKDSKEVINVAEIEL